MFIGIVQVSTIFSSFSIFKF